MKKIKLLLLLILIGLIPIQAQELVKGVTYDMPRKEAKILISVNEKALQFNVGTAEFDSPSIFCEGGLTKVVAFPEKNSQFKLGGSKEKAENKINDLKDFFLSKGYKLISEHQLVGDNSLLGTGTAGNALLMQKDSVYLSITYFAMNHTTGFKTEALYTLNIKITSVYINNEYFKKYMHISKPTEKGNADELF